MKHLIVSGCSFTQENIHPTWATYLNEYLSPETYVNTAKSSQGNSLISKGIFHNVCQKLEKGVNPEDIFVAIMWSGSQRSDFYVMDERAVETSAIQNPVKFNLEAEGAWRICNMNWKDSYSKTHYNNFYTEIGSYIYSLENILFIQNFLKLHGIKYLMTPFVHHLVFDKHNSIMANNNVRYYYNQIDFDNWIPSIYDWLTSNYDVVDIVRQEELEMLKRWDCCHPNATGHKYYFDKLIVPFIEKL